MTYKKHIANPCIGYCKLNHDDICGGCGRTQSERTDWIFLTATEQKTICENASKRLAKIKKDQ
ncbi:DUF1289 domain-containing protein [Algibacillus agarilyticus]|uniref:DUF1289 domain-containing protein n=1 Tax=Algibacillus agarilyticus TaxID=2234133 RepID=UPI000DCF9DA4|nr:DUF1289 domain-containing protein [Algibacillus agarilyticus]